MARDFRITGAEDFLKLSKVLKAAGQKDLRNELHKGLQAGAKPLIPLTRAAALEELPKGGGLASAVAKAPQRVQVRTGRNPGVRIVVTKRTAVRAANKGLIRHPVFADKRKDRSAWAWVEQRVHAGWFDQTIGKHVVEVLPHLEWAMQRVVDKIVKGAR